jgi:hypothetical protein
LIVACGDGSVVWYRNTGSKSEPSLAKGVALVPAAPTVNHDDNAPPTKEIKPGTRAKACVVDWNGDGHLDLLVGDFNMTYGEKPKLTEAEKKLEKETNARIQEVQKKLQPFYDEYFKKSQAGAKPDDSPKAKRDREQKALGVLQQKDCQQLQNEQSKLFETIRRFQRPMNYLGNVWLYLRKASASASR